MPISCGLVSLWSLLERPVGTGEQRRLLRAGLADQYQVEALPIKTYFHHCVRAWGLQGSLTPTLTHTNLSLQHSLLQGWV